MKLLKSVTFLAIALAAPPVAAQDEAEAPRVAVEDETIFDGDWATLGLGAGYAPSYEGSDDYVLFPAPLAQGSLAGFEFGARGPGGYVDLIRDSKSDSKVKFLAGPLVRLRFDRNRAIKDPVVAALGKRDVAIEVGGTVGISFEELLNDYDRLTISTDAQWDVADAHDGRIITPTVSYSTPLSPALFASLSLSATHADDKYARYYFGVDAAGSVASGLPVFAADGGWKDVSATLLGGVDFSGDVRDGGWGAFGVLRYGRLMGDFKRSPITSVRGDADQWLFAAGIGYTF